MTESTLFKPALSRAMALCSGREYCREDIHLKLVSWGLNEIECERIIAILINEKFIDEKRYSAAFTRDKFNHNKWGKIKIASHLRLKKIPSPLIANALESIDDDIYIKTLRELLNSHRKLIKAKNKYDLKGKLFRFALSRGFENGLIYDLLGNDE